MYRIGETYRSARDLGQWQRIWAGLIIVGSICAAAGAQIDANETGLHDGESVYGLYAPGIPIPYVNSEAIALFAWGIAAPNPYADVSFNAYGLFNNASLTNNGAVGVTARGGTTGVTGESTPATARFMAYGVYSVYGLIANGGQIYVTVLGGTADGTSANASADALGLRGYADVNNSGSITVTARGGIATSQRVYGTTASAEATALQASGDHLADPQTQVQNTGAITATATGGTVNSPAGFADADATAYGLSTSDINVTNTAPVTIAAQGGTARAGMMAQAYANGAGLSAHGGLLSNSGDITVTAIGGNITARDDARVHASAHGIFSTQDVDNNGTITVAATGGTASVPAGGDASAHAEAAVVGIESDGNVNNAGTLALTATGGTASVGHPYTEAHVTGIYAVGDVGNTGAITVAAVAGTTEGAVDAHTDASAYGINAPGHVVNHASLRVSATAGTAHDNRVNAYARASTEAYGIRSTSGPLANDGSIGVTATGGSVTGAAENAFRRAYTKAQAYGLLLRGEGGRTPLESESSSDGHTGGVIVSGSGFGSSDVLTIPGSAEFTAVAAPSRISGLLPVLETGNIPPPRYLDNRGHLTVAATGGNTQGSVQEPNASAWAYGILAADAPVSNSGRVLVTAAGGNALSTADDASLQPGAYAYAVTYGIGSDAGNLTNSEAITAIARGGTATGRGVAEAATEAQARGIYVLGEPYEWYSGNEAQTRVQNDGVITATATGGTANSTLDAAYADAVADGLFTAYASVNNAGSVAVAAQGGRAQAGTEAQAGADARGLSTSYGDVSNLGSITVTAQAGVAQAGAQAQAYAEAIGLLAIGGLVSNSGRITASALGGTAQGQTGFAHAEAIGLTAADADIRNSGEIAVIARAGDISASGSGGTIAYAEGIYAHASSVANSGNVTTTATGPEGVPSEAYGIRFTGAGTLTNTGIIRASGGTAYELYADAGSTVTLVNTYNVTLDGDPSRASLGVADGARLVLNHATLTVTALSGATRWGTEYKLFETQGTGVVDGNFADARAVNPNTTAAYHDQGTPGSVDDTVSLAYTPLGAPALASAAVQKQAIFQAADVINHHMTAALLKDLVAPPAGLLADAGSTAESLALAESASEKSHGIFVEPYYSLLDKDANPLGYNASLWGFSAGYERFLGNTLLGLHLGYGQSDIDYTGAGYSANNEDQDIVTGGFSGLTRWDPWTLRYGLTGFYGWHDYEGLTGLSLEEREIASYDSYGTATTLMAGHIFRWGPHVLLPEAGLDWLWTHRERYTTRAADPSWDTTYSALNDNDVYAAAALQWLSSFWCGKIRVTPSASVGVRHLLTDAQAGVWQSIPGAPPVLVRSEQDRTAVTLSGSLVLTRTPHAASLAYDGDYAPDARRHSLWLRYSWLF